MRNFLLVLFILSGIIFVGTIMLMRPKGGLGLGMGGIANSSEYGSQKSIEHSLKKVALVSCVIFVIVSIVLPYVQE